MIKSLVNFLILKWFFNINKVSEYRYYNKRIKQEYYNLKKLFYSENLNPPKANINQYLSNQSKVLNYQLNSLLDKQLSIEEIIDNDFFIAKDYELRLRAMDFFVINAFGLNDAKIGVIFKYLNGFMKRFKDVRNPPLSEPFGNSLRLNNLIWFYQLAFQKLNTKQKSDLIRMIILFGDLLCLFLEDHLDNNHTIVQSKNLLLAGLVFKDIKKSKRWIKRGQSVLTTCLKKQISKSGVHIERTTMYQKVVFSELLELSAFVTKYPDEVNLAFKQLLWKKLKLMAAYDREMTFDKGYYSLWGDGYFGDRLIRFVPVYSTDNKKSPYEENIKLWSCHLDFKDFGSKNTVETSLINQSGFIYSQSGGITLILNAGTNLSKQKFSKGHLHSDLLSFVLFKDGKELIANAGTFDYTKDSIPYFRGTRGHNTIMIDGFEQHGWQDKSQAGHFADGFVDLVEEKNGFHYIDVHHDGYDRIGVSHKRNMVHDLKKKTITITDLIEGTGDHPFEYTIHFVPGLECVLSGSKILIEDTYVMKFDIPDNCSMKLFYGDEHPGAWRCQTLRKKEPLWLLIISGKFSGKTKISAFLDYA